MVGWNGIEWDRMVRKRTAVATVVFTAVAKVNFLGSAWQVTLIAW